MRINKRRGFTLPEFLLIALFEMLAIMVAVQLFISLNTDYKVMISYLNNYLRGREVIDRISKDVRIGIQVMDSYDTYSTTDNRLVLKVPSIDAAGDIIDVNNEFDYIIYWVASGDLWKKVIPGSVSSRPAYNNILKKSIQSLYMENNGVSLSGIAHKSSITHITIWVSVKESVLGKDYIINPGTTVKLMNYEWEFVR